MDGADLRVHRIGAGRIVGWAVAVAAVLGLLDIVRRGQLVGDDLPVGLGCVAVIGLCYLLGIRPAVLELPEALVVRNPLRTNTVPWSAITDVTTEDVVVVHLGEQRVRCFALPRRGRGGRPTGVSNPGVPSMAEPPPAARRGASGVAERIRSRAEQLGPGHRDDAAVTELDPMAVAVGALVVGLGVAALVTALLS